MNTQKIKQLILDGKTYAIIDRVTSSGMTRYMRFYIIYEGKMRNVTQDIASELKRRLDKRNNIRVVGCGMDMIFYTLYTYLGRDLASLRGQQYTQL